VIERYAMGEDDHGNRGAKYRDAVARDRIF